MDVTAPVLGRDIEASAKRRQAEQASALAGLAHIFPPCAARVSIHPAEVGCIRRTARLNQANPRPVVVPARRVKMAAMDDHGADSGQWPTRSCVCPLREPPCGEWVDHVAPKARPPSARLD
jgi:hypothetical protein